MSNDLAKALEDQDENTAIAKVDTAAPAGRIAKKSRGKKELAVKPVQDVPVSAENPFLAMQIQLAEVAQASEDRTGDYQHVLGEIFQREQQIISRLDSQYSEAMGAAGQARLAQTKAKIEAETIARRAAIAETLANLSE